MWIKLRKNYINLQKAARISGYSSDYIGYLIRKGKIEGKRICSNTSWQISSKEIVKYCQKNNLDIRYCPFLKKKGLSLKETAQVLGYTPDYIGYLIRKGKIPGKKVFSGVAWLTTNEGIKEYQKKFKIKSVREQPIARLVYDIFPPEKIKEAAREITGLKPYKTKFEKIFAISWRLSLAGIILFLLIGIGPVEIFQKIIGAFTEETKTVNFYSTLCEGDWQNPQNAQGEPDVSVDGDFNSFSEVNSAVYQGGSLGLVCQNFNTNEDLKNLQFQSAKIKFSFAIGEKNVEFTPLLETPNPEETPPEIPSLESVTPPEEGIEPSVIPMENTTPNEEGVVQPPQEPEPKEEIPIKPEEVPQEESSPTSFWEKIKEVFGALIVKAQEEISPLETVTPQQEGIVEPIETTENGSPPIETVTQPMEGIQDVLPNLDAKIIIWYSLNGEDWQILETISTSPLSNFSNGGYFSYDVPFLKNWDDVKNLQIKFEGVVGGETSFIAYLDSVWVEVNYQEKIEEPKKIFKIKIKDNSLVMSQFENSFSITEEPVFIITEPELPVEEIIKNKKGEVLEEIEIPKTQESEKSLLENVKEKILEPIIDLVTPEVGAQAKNIKTKIFGPDGAEINIPPTINSIFVNGKESFEIKIPRENQREFKPGLYKLEIEFETKEAIYILEQDFSWGVLAINTNKSIYLSAEASAKADLLNETAYLQMAALKNDGHTICDANLELEIIPPSGGRTSATIQKSGECGADNVTDKPDYFAYYQVEEVGIYKMRLTRLTEDGPLSIEDSFEVRESVPFEVERVGPTRIWPKANYEMTLKIKANQNFEGEIIESVPVSFNILDCQNCLKRSFKQIGLGTQEIYWEVDWKAGENYELKYQFDAQDISPYLYLLGPLEFQEYRGQNIEFRESQGNPNPYILNPIFSETRQWQIAADATGGQMTLLLHRENPDANTTYNVITLTQPSPTTATDSATVVALVTPGAPCESAKTTGNTITTIVVDDDSTPPGTGDNCLATFFSLPVGQSISIETTDTNSLYWEIYGSNTAADNADTNFVLRFYKFDGASYTLFGTLTTGDLATGAQTNALLTATATPSVNVTLAAGDRIVAVLSINVIALDTSTAGDTTSILFGTTASPAFAKLSYTVITPNKPDLTGTKDDDFTTALATTDCTNSTMTSETRYMRTSGSTVNGLYAYDLLTSQGAFSGSANFNWYNTSVYVTQYLGIRVWKRSAGGQETEITSAVSAIASGDSSGLISATWTPSATSLSSSDSIVVRVYGNDVTPPISELATFSTPQLSASQLDAQLWTVYYYLDRESYLDCDPEEPGNQPCTFYYFNWDTATYQSRIANFSYTPVATPYNTKWACTTPSGTTLGTMSADVVAGANSSQWLILRDKEDATLGTNFGTSPENVYIYQTVDTNANGDGTISTVVNSTINASAGTSPYFHSGLLLWASNTDYLIIEAMYDGTNRGLAINDDGVISNSTAISLYNRIWLRWSKTSTNYQAQYSTDGSSWTNLGTAIAHATTFTRAGLNSYAAAASTEYAGAFEWFDYALVLSITVSGNAYGDEGTTVWTGCDGATARISLVVNGGTASTTSCHPTTPTPGYYSFTGVTVETDNPVSVFFNTAGANTDKGVAVTVAAASNITLNPRKDRVWVKTEGTVANITNANLNHCDSDAPAQCANVPYAVDASSNLTVESGRKIVIESAKTFAPGGNVTTPAMRLVGTYTASSYTLTLNAGGTSATCTDVAGTVMPLCIDGGTFTAGTSTVNYTGTTATTLAVATYYNLGVGTTADATAVTYTLGGNTTVSSVLTVGNASSTATDILAGSSYTLTLSGSGTPFNITAWGTFSAGTSTVNYTGAAATTLAVATYYNLGVGTTADATAVTYTLGGSTTVSNVLTVGNASSTVTDTLAGSSYTLTLSGSGTPFVLTAFGTFSAGTSTVNYTGTAATTLATTTYNNLNIGGSATTVTYTAAGNITVTNILTIVSSSGTNTFDASSYTITLSGTGTPFVIGSNGVFTYSTSTIAYTGATTATNVTSTTYYKLNIGGSATTTTYTAAGDITVTNILTIVSSSGANTFNASNRTITLSGTGTPFVIGFGEVFTYSTSTVVYSGATTATNVKNTTYYNLNIGGAATTTTYTAAGNITVTNILTIVSSSGTNTFDASSYTITLSGTGTPFVIGSNGVFTYSTSTIAYTGATTATNVTSTTYYKLNIGGSATTTTYTAAGNITVTNILTIVSSSGTNTFSASSYTITLSGTGTPFVIGFGEVFTYSTSTVVYSGATTATNVTSTTYYNLNIGGATTTTTYTAAGNITVTNILTIVSSSGANTFSASSYTITLSGTTGTPFVISGTFTGSTSTFIYSGDYAAGNTTIAASANYYNVQINNATETYTLGGATTLSGDFTATAGTLSGTNNITVNGGDVTGNGTISLSGGTLFTLDGAGNFGGASDWWFYNLTIGGNATVETTTATGAGYITINNVLTIGANQTLNAGSKTWYLPNSGTPFVLNGTLTPSTSRFYYYANAATNIAAATYYDLWLYPNATSPVVYTATGAITANNSLDIRAVGSSTFTFNLGGATSVSGTTYVQRLGGTVTLTLDTTTNNYDFTSSSLIINSAGTLNANGSVITLTGSGTPFSLSGTFNAQTSTFKYTGTAATNITATTYNNLELLPSANGITFTLGTAGSQTINATGYLTIGNGTNTGTITAVTYDPNLNIDGNVTISASAALTASDLDTATFTVAGNWSNSTTATFTHSSGTVTFDATATGKTISDGGDPFYNISFTGTNGGWTYTDGSSTTPNQTTVSATNGVATYVNAKTGTVSVTGGTLNVDWYLGAHVVDAANTATNIDTGNADITISENSATPASTVWRYNAGAWGSVGTGWEASATSKNTGTNADGKNPQPFYVGAIRIREYSMTASATCPGAGCTLYKYNLQIVWQSTYGEYNYYTDYGQNYLTSCRAGDTPGSDPPTCSNDSTDDDVIGSVWYRSAPGTMNTVGTVNEPPTNGSWYVGMLKGLEVTIWGTSINFADLSVTNDFTNTASTQTEIRVTTSSVNGYVVTAWETQLMTCSDSGACASETIPNFTHGSYADPEIWDTSCNTDPNHCGFGFTSSDPSVETINRYNSGTEYTYFPTSSSAPVRVSDNPGPIYYPTTGSSYLITYRISVSPAQRAGPYTTTIVYVITAQY